MTVTSFDKNWITKRIAEKQKWYRVAGQKSRPLITEYILACQYQLKKLTN